jgi:nucleotide-binding universal stress UspA family protein
MRRIVAPTDFSEGATQLVAWAVALARHFGGALVLLHVIELSVSAREAPVSSGVGILLLQKVEQHACFALAQMLPEAYGAIGEVTYQVVCTPPRRLIEVAATRCPGQL